MAASIHPEAKTASDRAPRPDRHSHYEFRARLGEGGFGAVYEAWDTRLQRSVAVKTIRHGGGAGVDLVREARLAASLRHPAFVKVHAVEDDGEAQFIVMELVHGRTLKQMLRDGPVPLPTALDWIGQVADAMRDAHASGLVHGDLKPSNLMVGDDGRVRILDFGLALRQDVLATEAVPLGTPDGAADPLGTIAYMAPERLQGAAPDARADVYALGVVLYELAGGQRPFATLHGLALAAALVQTSSDGWDYPGHLEAPLIALIRALTARQPDQRVADMNEVLRRLAALDGTAAIPAAGVFAPAARRRRLPRAARLAAGVVLAAVAGGVAWRQAPDRVQAFQASVRQALAPYSEARDMQQGLAALRLFDRPGALDEAQRHFERVLAHTPDNAAAVAGISLVHSARYAGDREDETWLQRADASAQQALRLNDLLALAHVAAAAVREGQGRYDDAVAACDRALRLDPANDFAWYIKAETLRRARRYPDARAALAQAMRRFPRERVFVDELGSVESEQGHDAAAESLFRHSMALEPDAVVAYANLAGTLLRENRADEAARVLQQGLQLRPSAILYTNLGNILFQRGDYVGAADAFQNAVAPRHGNPGLYLNWANLGDTLLWIPGRAPEARAAYDKARSLLAPRLARAPNDVLLVSRMGLYSARAGDAARALELAARAVALAPNAADVQFRAGLSYELLGERARALEAIGSALRLGYPRSFVEAEPDLVALRRDPGYRAD